MVELDVGMLRCIFQQDGSHAGEPNLRVVVTGNPNIQLLACIGCRATYLVKAGLPIMLEDSQLTSDDRRVLQRVRHQYQRP